MKRVLRVVLLILALAVPMHLLAVWSLPRVAMLIATRIIADKAGGANRAHHTEPTTEDNNIVVMQNADTLASWCVYDLAAGPLRVQAAVPATYWSLSLYDMDTDNYYVKNDRQVSGDRAELILVGQGAERPRTDGVEIVESPTQRGIVIFRNLVRHRGDIDGLVETQRQASCTPL